MKGKCWCAWVLALMMLAVAGCGWKQTIAEGGETKLPKETESSVDAIKETETEPEKVTWIASSQECPSWDAMQRCWEVQGDTIYMVKTEWRSSGGTRHVIVSLDKEGNVIREMPVNMVWDDWMPCEGFTVEEDDSFVLVAEAPDSLNEGERKRKVSYVKVNRDGNVLLNQEIHELLGEEKLFASEAAFAGNGWSSVSVTPCGKTLLWNPENEFVGTVDSTWVVASRSGELYAVSRENGKCSYAKVLPELQIISENVAESPVEAPHYLQAGIYKEFIAVDRVGVVEFTPGEEPIYLLEFADYGLERRYIHGLQVQGEDILLMEQKKTEIPVLWRFQKP